jgi:hypothetical protein
MSLFRALAIAPLGFCLALGAGCAVDDELDDDDVLFEDDDKADSLRTPTKHGWLSFDSWAGATVKSGQKFHSWRFELSGAASVSFETGTADVDTIVYLYKYNSRTQRWGYPIAKNDDMAHAVSGESRLDRDLDKGIYRLIVKSKDARGTIELEASCSGDGCPEGEAACRFDDLAPAPEATELTQGCLRQVDAVVNGAPTVQRDNTVSIATRGSLVPNEKRALELVVQGECATDIFQEFDMSSSLTSTGAVVIVNTDPDVGMDSRMVMTGDRVNLLSYSWMHDSGSYSWHCADDDTAEHETVDEYCLFDYLRQGLHAAEGEIVTGSGTGTSEDAPESLDSIVLMSLYKHEEAGGAPIDTYTWEQWQTADGQGTRVAITADGHTTTYVTGGHSTDTPLLMLRSTDAHIEMPCIEL